MCSLAPPVISPQTSTHFETICRNNSLRHLAGTLDNCNLIDNNFRIGYDVKIVLIPESSNLLLLGLAVPFPSCLIFRFVFW